MFGVYRFRKWLKKKLMSLSGIPAHLVRYPFGNEPWKRKNLDVFRDIGIGDVLMCTSVLREVRKKNPKIYIRFYTDYPELIDGLSYINEVHLAKFAPRSAIKLRYEEAIPTKVHLAKIMGGCLGIKVSDTTPDCIIDYGLSDSYKKIWSDKKTIIVLLRASRWTPNKDWPIEYWDKLISTIANKYRIVLIGAQSFFEKQNISFAKYCLDLRDKISLKELVALIAASDLYVGPVSGPSHIAAAVGIPSVEICGGYELPENTNYSKSKKLAHRISCSPCWLQTDCPYEKKCLTSILPSEVEKNIESILGKSP